VNGRRTVEFVGKMGGIIPTPEEILSKVETCLESTNEQFAMTK
jgi:hypothetical protein